MNPILRAVSQLLHSDSDTAGLSTAELAESLSRETRIRIATRLALVKLAARCEQAGITSLEQLHPCEVCAPMIARRLGRLAEADDETAMTGLVDLAPALRELAGSLEQEGHPMAVVPEALLELLQAQLH